MFIESTMFMINAVFIITWLAKNIENENQTAQHLF